MSKLKTQPTDLSVETYLKDIEPEDRRSDCRTILDMMQEITGSDPVMWGDSIVGFGSYHYIYASGREGDWPLTGFSSRKQAITLYLMGDVQRQSELLEKLGKWKAGKGCLYIKRMSDVNPDILRQLVENSVQHLKEKYSTK